MINSLIVGFMQYYTDIDRDGQVISRFGGLPESYIFPSDYIFPKRAALRENIVTRENITLTAPPKRDISPSRSISVILHGQNDGFIQI